MKLSVLIFSMGYVEKTIDIIKDIYDVADEIVVIDSSTQSERKLLALKKKELELKKVNFYYVIPLGYPDPMRMYALGKCTCDWVLLLDTDERLSAQFKDGIKHVIRSAKCSAYAIRRYEEVKDEKKLPFFFTWQIRLFKRDRVEFRGIPHEQPLIKGTLHRIERKDYYMMHLSALMSRKTSEQYGEMEKFERLTYELQNKKVMEYLTKVTMPKNREDIKDYRLGRFVSAMMRSYQKVTFKKEDQELTNFDYFVYYSLLDLAYYMEEKNISGIFHIIPSQRRHLQQIRKWKSEAEGKEVLEISKIINRIGIIKFLKLDRESEIRKINRKYGQEGGIALLIELIKQRYESMRVGNEK